MSQPDEEIHVELGKSKMNVEDQVVLDNISTNIRRPLPQAQVQESSAKRAVLVAGGPSLRENLELLREKYFWKGIPIVAMNGSAKFLMLNGIKPSSYVLCDAREDNLLFFIGDFLIPDCRYYVASHCSPKVFDRLEQAGADIWIYHTAPIEPATKLLEDYYQEHLYQVNGGCTVGLCSIALTRMIGYPYMSLFGYDSCCKGKNTVHAYRQDIDSDEPLFKVEHSGKEFLCTGWQMRQADNFYNLIIHYGKFFTLKLYGEGLLGHILSTGIGIDLEAKEA